MRLRKLKGQNRTTTRDTVSSLNSGVCRYLILNSQKRRSCYASPLVVLWIACFGGYRLGMHIAATVRSATVRFCVGCSTMYRSTMGCAAVRCYPMG